MSLILKQYSPLTSSGAVRSHGGSIGLLCTGVFQVYILIAKRYCTDAA